MDREIECSVIAHDLRILEGLVVMVKENFHPTEDNYAADILLSALVNETARVKHQFEKRNSRTKGTIV